jgi:hypothetical protein
MLLMLGPFSAGLGATDPMEIIDPPKLHHFLSGIFTKMILHLLYH